MKIAVLFFFLTINLQRCYTVNMKRLAVIKLAEDGLDMLEALKFARHDFLNELQLILLYLDLDKETEAREKILEYTTSMRQFAMLERLRLPKLESWLTTFSWRYSSFTTQLSSDIVAGNRASEEEGVIDYLNLVMADVEKAVNPMVDYELNLIVTATNQSWSVTIQLDGALEEKSAIPHVSSDFSAEEKVSTEQWTFTISGQ